jgi:phage terminase small subunit
MIYRLAELYVRREATKDEFRRSGGHAIIKQTNKGGNVYAVKNPLLTEIDFVDRTILEMEKELGLTPQAIRKINEAALGKKPQPEDDPLALALGELKLLKTGT